MMGSLFALGEVEVTPVHLAGSGLAMLVLLLLLLVLVRSLLRRRVKKNVAPDNLSETSTDDFPTKNPKDNLMKTSSLDNIKHGLDALTHGRARVGSVERFG